MLDFTGLPLIANAALFATAAVGVWIAGTRIARYASGISDRTGLGEALLGLMLLAGATSLPELAVSLSSAWAGNAPLAVNNLLGGVAMQIAFLAVADALIGRRALTSVVPDPIVMLQGALNIILLVLVAVAVLIGDPGFFGVGLWTTLILVVALLGLKMQAGSQDRQPWLAKADGGVVEPEDEDEASETGEDALSQLIWKTAAAAGVILVAGYIVSRSGDAIGEQTGLGSSFTGAVLLALATSLPEISTVISAVKLRRYTMALSDILGTTLFNIALLFFIDVVASGQPVLNAVGDFSLFASLLCGIITAIFLAGLAERRDRTILHMGFDSAAVLVTYIGGLGILYSLR